MANIGDISQAASYRGTPYLGGSIGVGVTIDSTPLEKLATFQYYRDRDLWQKKQVDDRLAAKEISDMTAYDITSPMKGYSDYLKGKLDEIKNYVRDNPNALNYDKNPEGFKKFKELEGQFQTARTAANTSEVIYNARKTAIDKEVDNLTKDVLRSRLDLDVNKLFQEGIDGALNNTLNSTPELKSDEYKLQDIPLTKRTKIIRNPNDIEIGELTFIDPAQAQAQADAIVFGFKKPLDETTPRFKALSDAEKEQERKEFGVISAPRLALKRIADGWNEVLSGLKTANPNLKVADITPDMLQDGTMKAIIDSGNLYNQQIDKLNALTGENYKKLNMDDGLSESEILLLNAFQKNKNNLYSEEKKIQQTDNQIQEDQIKAANYREKLQQNGANYRANLPYEKIKLAASADAAKEFGNIIFGINSPEIKFDNGKGFKRMVDSKGKALKIVNGAVIDNNGVVQVDITGDFTVPASALDNTIITEFNKYAGANKILADGTVVPEASPSRLKKNDDGTYTVKYENGIIKGILTDDGTYATDDQFQYITTQSSQKGVTKYKKPEDISGGNILKQNSKTVKVPGL